MASKTVAEIMDYYAREHGESTLSWRKGKSLRAVILNTFGPRPVSEIRVSDYKAYIRTRRAQEAADGTIRAELTGLATAIHYAETHGELAPGIAAPVFKPDAPEPKVQPLREEQVTQLMQAAAEAVRESIGGKYWKYRLRDQIWLHFAFNTGARTSAIEGLTWPQIDRQLGLIDFAAHYTTKKKRGGIVPISDALRPWIELAERHRESDFVLFHDQPIYPAFVRLGASIDIKVNPHITRHTFASLALQNGVSMEEVAAMLGDTVATVERVYAKFDPKRLRGAVAWTQRLAPAQLQGAA
jgi:integrase